MQDKGLFFLMLIQRGNTSYTRVNTVIKDSGFDRGGKLKLIVNTVIKDSG